MPEVEFREYLQFAATNPSVNQKLDLVIALLTGIFQTTATTAGSWVKRYDPPKINDLMPRWGKKGKKKKRMTAQEALAKFNMFSRR